MRTTKMFITLFLALCLIVCQAKVSGAPMGTEFTYQGRLIDANDAADGEYDFEFKLYDDPSAGTQQGSTIYLGEVDVIDGYFTVGLDFGSGVFDGDARWLQIGVRPGDLNDPNLYTLLEPRQEVTPTPYALYAKNAQTAGSDSDWMVDGDDMYSIPTGNIGIGTMEPSDKLEIASLYSSIRFKVSGYTPQIWFRDQEEHEWRIGCQYSEGSLRFSPDDLVGNAKVTLLQGGEVGIGTTTPDRKLEVRGAEAYARITAAGSDDAGLELLRVGTGFFDWRIYDTEGYLRFAWSDDDLVTVNDVISIQPSTERIGIGVAEPSGKLVVKQTKTQSTGTHFHFNASSGVAENSADVLKVSSGRGDSFFGALFRVDNSIDNKFYIRGDGNVGIGTDSPTQAKLVVWPAAGQVGIFIRSTTHSEIEMDTGTANIYSNGPFYLGSKTDDDLYFVTAGPTSAKMTIKNNGNVGIGTITPDYKLQVNGDVCPESHKGSDLGKSGLAWDDIYCDDLHNQGAAAFTDRQVTEEILQYPPMAKKPGTFDYMTERGLEELDPYSLPDDLYDGFDLLTDEMTTYNYKANYEQQLQIEKLLEENEALKQRIAALEKAIQNQKLAMK